MTSPLHFTAQGPGGDTTIVLVHGLGGRREQTAALADELSRDSRVVSVDLLGHGTSPVAHGATGMPAHIEALGLLIEELAPSRVAVVGHSAGGTTALCMTNRVPGIESLTFLDSSLILSDTVHDWAGRLVATLERDGFHKTLKDHRRASLGEWAGAAITDEIDQAIDVTDPDVGSALLCDAMTIDARDELRRSPSRLCYVHSFRSITRAQLTAVRPDIAFHRVERAGHWVQMEHPREVADIIRSHVFTAVPVDAG